jgi:hypothetical protein
VLLESGKCGMGRVGRVDPVVWVETRNADRAHSKRVLVVGFEVFESVRARFALVDFAVVTVGLFARAGRHLETVFELLALLVFL